MLLAHEQATFFGFEDASINFFIVFDFTDPPFKNHKTIALLVFNLKILNVLLFCHAQPNRLNKSLCLIPLTN